MVQLLWKTVWQLLKKLNIALAGVAQWTEHQSSNQRVTTQSGHMPGYVWEATTLLLLSLSFSLPSPLSQNEWIKLFKKKLNTEWPYQTALPLLGIYSKEFKTHPHTKNLYASIHSSSTHDSENPKMPSNWRTGKRSTARPQGGVLLTQQ